PEYFRESNPLIPERIIEEQSLDIDTSTGATFSAKGIVQAVLNALDSESGGED
ncbi:MAG: FMN-binding protein, partial [Dethiobacteria bacterium]